MAELILLRHGQSQWNLENRFTGWVDVPLSPKGILEAKAAGMKIQGRQIDQLFTSVLQRAMHTAQLAFEVAAIAAVPTTRAQELNERMYGDLQGLNKAEAAKQWGDEQIKIWRRSYDVPPPNGESLADTAARVIPYWEQHILPVIKTGKNVLIAAHGNSLRALVMHLKGLTRAQVLELEIPTGAPLLFELDATGHVTSERYL